MVFFSRLLTIAIPRLTPSYYEATADLSLKICLSLKG